MTTASADPSTADSRKPPTVSMVVGIALSQRMLLVRNIVLTISDGAGSSTGRIA